MGPNRNCDWPSSDWTRRYPKNSWAPTQVSSETSDSFIACIHCCAKLYRRRPERNMPAITACSFDISFRAPLSRSIPISSFSTDGSKSAFLVVSPISIISSDVILKRPQTISKTVDSSPGSNMVRLAWCLMKRFCVFGHHSHLVLEESVPRTLNKFIDSTLKDRKECSGGDLNPSRRSESPA